MITSTDNRSSLRLQRGWTLLEMMIASGAASIVLLALFTSYSMTTRGFVSTGNYFDMEQSARQTLEFLGRDARQATGLTAFASTDISMGIPTNFNANGTISGAKTVRYYQGTGADSNKLFRVDCGATSIVAYDVSSVQFIEYDRNLVSSGISPSDCKLLQVNVTLRKYTINNPNTEQILSARVVMRNKLLP